VDLASFFSYFLSCAFATPQLAGTEALTIMSPLPAILIVLYGGLFFVRRKQAMATSTAG